MQGIRYFLRRFTYEQLFLVIGLTGGLFYLFITPPFQAPDEYNHFFRAYEVSLGKLVPIKTFRYITNTNSSFFIGYDPSTSIYTVGDYLPTSVEYLAENVSYHIPGKMSRKQDTSKLLEMLKIKTNLKNRSFLSFPNTAIYSPVIYIPQTLGVLTARILFSHTLIEFYFARIFNLITYLLLIYFAIKFTPILKGTFFLLGIMPMSLFLGASVSPDSIIISTSLLFISLTLKVFEDPEDITKSIFNIFLVLAFIMGSAKTAYALIPLFFGINLLNKKNFKRKLLLFVSIIALSLGSTLIWLKIASFLYIPLQKNVEVLMQLGYLVAEPINFLKIIINTFFSYKKYLIQQFIGTLGWLDVPLPLYLVYPFFILLIFSSIIDFSFTSCLNLSRKERIFTGLMCLIILFTIAISLYLTWTPFKKPIIDGLVGRYFIPIFPFFAIAVNLPAKKLIHKATWLKMIYMIMALCSVYFTTIALTSRYY